MYILKMKYFAINSYDCLGKPVTFFIALNIHLYANKAYVICERSCKYCKHHASMNTLMH